MPNPVVTPATAPAPQPCLKQRLHGIKTISDTTIYLRAFLTVFPQMAKHMDRRVQEHIFVLNLKFFIDDFYNLLIFIRVTFKPIGISAKNFGKISITFLSSGSLLINHSLWYLLPNQI